MAEEAKQDGKLPPTENQYDKLERQLFGILAKGPRPIKDLPQNLRDPSFLQQACTTGRLNFGRPDHSFRPTKIVRQGEDEGKPTADAKFDANSNVELVIGKGPIDWMKNRPGEGFTKTISELLQEESTVPDEIKLHVRLI